MRSNQETGEEYEVFETSGKITSVLQKVKTNSNEKEYKTFFATVTFPRGPVNVAGSLYLSFIESLGKEPVTGDKFNFQSRIEDLKEGINYHWAISGQGVDEVVTDNMADIDAM